MSEHPELKNLYDQVIRGSFSWGRWGLLGALSDYILYYTQGDILEIGCGESSIYFSKLAEKYNRQCYHIEFSKSGIYNMFNTKGYFGKNSITYNCKSDEFFEMEKPTPLALAFIDGDHEYEQVTKDFFNTWDYIVKDGFVFLHDTYPPDKSWIVPQKCGTVYKLRQILEAEGYDMFTFKKSAFDVGLTMIRKEEEGKEKESFNFKLEVLKRGLNPMV